MQLRIQLNKSDCDVLLAQVVYYGGGGFVIGEDAVDLLGLGEYVEGHCSEFA